MFPKSVTQASTSFFDVDLVTCVAFDSINHILADTSHHAALKTKNRIWKIDNLTNLLCLPLNYTKGRNCASVKKGLGMQNP